MLNKQQQVDGMHSIDVDLFNLNRLFHFWGVSDYVEDHINFLHKSESNRVEFHFITPQIQFRCHLVTWLKQIAHSRQLDTCCLHLTIYLMDVFMDNYCIVQHKLRLVGLVCLWLATKLEEVDTKFVTASELNQIVGNKYQLRDFLNTEMIILNHLNFSINFPTAAHFIHSAIGFLLIGVEHESKKAAEQMWSKARHLINHYLDFMLNDLKLSQERPSLVSAAIFASVRISLGIVNVWPLKLAQITRYEFYELESTIQGLRNVCFFCKAH